MRPANTLSGILQAKNCLRTAVTVLGLGCCVVLNGCPDAVVYTSPIVFRPPVVYQPAVVYPPPVVYQPGVVYQPQVQVQETQAPAAPPTPEVTPAVQQLEPLVAPVALYPDPLLAVVLPASTYPDAVQDASKWVAANPQPQDAAIDAQAWPVEVKALVHYPDALTYLSGDVQFTTSLGSAYNSQPANVTLAVQDLRVQANTAGSLQTNSQQVVIQQAGVIAIQPATPTVIFVPQYDPVTIYAVGFTPIVYGPSFVVGPWLVNGYDWAGGGIYVGDWEGPYYYDGGRWGYHDHWDHPEHWRHDDRFGHAPYGPPGGHYHYAREVAGRENVMRQHVAQHAAAVRRENAARASTGGNRAGQTPGRTNGAGPTAGRTNGFGQAPGQRPGMNQGAGGKPGGAAPAAAPAKKK